MITSITNNKTSAAYWESKVTFQSAASKTYSVQIQHDGEQKWIGLRTANREQAAILALNFYLDIRANGWEAALARRKGVPGEKKVNVTIGEYLDAVCAKSLIYPKTLQSYAQALRKIAGDIYSLPSREAGQLKLASLTPEKIKRGESSISAGGRSIRFERKAPESRQTASSSALVLSLAPKS
jgi:hypothetical protein